MLFQGLLSLQATAQDSLATDTLPTRAALVVYKDTLVTLQAPAGMLSAYDRATLAKERIEKLYKEDLWDSTQVHWVTSDAGTLVYHGEQALFNLVPADTTGTGQTVDQLAAQAQDRMIQSVWRHQNRADLWDQLWRVATLVTSLLIIFFGVRYLNRGLNKLNTAILLRLKRMMKGVKLGQYEFLTPERQGQLAQFLLTVSKWVIMGVVLYLALPALFSIFPATKGLANTLFHYILTPLVKFGRALLGYLPALFTIVVIVVITRYLVRGLRFLSMEVERGKLQLPGFYSDWARPTFALLRVILYAFAFVMIFPYLPGSDSPIFRGVSVFFGLLISLGSSSAIGNIIAGLVITYMRAFKEGDRVKIGDTTGDVIEKSLLVTRVRTIKNEDVSIPNAAILNGSTVNYSSSAKELGLVLTSTVTIGYDVDWRTVHQLLLAAAAKTQLVETKPAPYVLQTSLDDFYVSYAVHVYTCTAGKAARIQSELHGHILDAFNEAGVEIMSPHYRAERDGSAITIPAQGSATRE